MTVALHSNGVCSGGPPLETPLPSSLLRGHTLMGKEEEEKAVMKGRCKKKMKKKDGGV